MTLIINYFLLFSRGICFLDVDFELNNSDAKPLKPYFLSDASKKLFPATDRNKMRFSQGHLMSMILIIIASTLFDGKHGMVKKTWALERYFFRMIYLGIIPDQLGMCKCFNFTELLFSSVRLKIDLAELAKIR